MFRPWFVSSYPHTQLTLLLQGVHAILIADPSVQESVLELLLPHFVQFVQTETPFLKLDACVTTQVRIACERPVYPALSSVCVSTTGASTPG